MNASPSLASVIGTSLVTIVISAAISDPVASVAMNESIFMTTTTTPLIKDAEADGERDRDRRDERNPVLGDQVRDDDAGERDDEREREVEDARRERTVIARAASAVIALALRICFAVARFGNVSGTQTENSTMIPSQT